MNLVDHKFNLKKGIWLASYGNVTTFVFSPVDAIKHETDKVWSTLTIFCNNQEKRSSWKL